MRHRDVAETITVMLQRLETVGRTGVYPISEMARPLLQTLLRKIRSVILASITITILRESAVTL